VTTASRWCAWALVGALLASGGVSSGQEASLRFKPEGVGEFGFNTGALRGKLHEAGVSKGLTQVVHVPTGTRLDSSMGLFSHYRVFTQGRRYGVGAWDWPSQATLEQDGSVTVRWPAATDRPFDLSAHYRWATPTTLDLETSVSARTNLVKFESFLASYFSPGFTNALVRAGNSGLFERVSTANGAWQAFPRDEAARLVIQDGRWKLEPHPVDWVLRPTFSKPLAIRRSHSAKIIAGIMADPHECFAICTPQETDGHYSTYLSLFGRDIKVGERATARARLAVIEGADAEGLTSTWENLSNSWPEQEK
jgi:hypothetical protein